jgi:hypothetical protein
MLTEEQYTQVTLNSKENRLHDEKSFGSGSSNWPGHHDRLVHCMKMISIGNFLPSLPRVQFNKPGRQVGCPSARFYFARACTSSAWTKLLPSEAEDLQEPANPEFDLDSPQPLSEPDLAQDQDPGEQLGIVKQ